MQKQIETIPAAALKALMEWEWPGNVRELQNFIERAVILTRGKALEAPLAELEKRGIQKPVGSLNAGGREEIVRIVREAISEMNEGGSKGAAKEHDERQREEIERVLGETKGRVGGAEGAAARLGVNPTTLLARMKKPHHPSFSTPSTQLVRGNTRIVTGGTESARPNPPRAIGIAGQLERQVGLQKPLRGSAPKLLSI
jgi:transcriptional regulator with GAF, ATPase, and Fis domain